MHHQGDVPVQTQRRQQPVEVMVGGQKAVTTGAVAGRQLFRIALPDQIRRDHPATADQLRNHIAPQVRGGGVAVQQHDRVALSFVHIGDALAVDVLEMFLVGHLVRNHGGGLLLMSGAQLNERARI